LILKDYRDFFATKFIGTKEKHVGSSIDVNRLKKLFENKDCFVSINEFSDVDFTKDYSNWYVIYASSEDNGGFYKEYIEDVLLMLLEKGAILIPSFSYFRAHSNKCFQEMIRCNFKDDLLKNPKGLAIGHYKELNLIIDKISYPAVAKISYGSGSRGVMLAENSSELKRVVKKLMTHRYFDFSQSIYIQLGVFCKRLLRILTNKRRNNEKVFSAMRSNKIIIQEYIPNLNGDQKVLYFGGKYFVLCRENRDHDFRASGSGKFLFPQQIKDVKNILDFSRRVVEELKMPIMSLDIGENKNGCFLLEFQCLYFGPYTLQYAPICYEFNDNHWSSTNGAFDLEEEYVRSILLYINNM
jgi:glutathione synthase/RimK-type ligase-like ATP-grasp enzyme